MVGGRLFPFRGSFQKGSSLLWLPFFFVLLLSFFSDRAYAQTELVANGGFEAGSSSWVLSGAFQADSRFSFPRSGSGYAYLSNSDGTAGNNLVGTMYQTLNVPSSATSATLVFWYNITTQETGSTVFDVLNVTVQSSTGNVLGTVAVLSNLNSSAIGAYSQRTFDLTPYKGQTIRVHFLGTTDGSLPTTFRIDDVSVSVTINSVPAAPSNLLATALSSSTATLGWGDNSTSETGFKIERKTGTGGTYSQIGTQGANLNFFNDSGLAAATQYCYRVRAYNGTGDSGYSNESCTTTSGNLPGSFTLSANAYCNTTPPVAPAVLLTWSTSSGATSYDVYRNGSSYASGITGTSYNNNLNVTAGQTYSYYVVARNSAGSTQSNTLTVTVSTNICPITNPTPSISSVSPNPVTGSDSSQTFTINGSNFVPGAAVTLRDLRTGEVFPNRSISFLIGTQIVINPIFTTFAAQWTVEVINLDGGSSGRVSFQVIAPTVTPTISGVSPNPVPGSSSPQTFTINGSNFVSGATVTLTDTITGEVFANRPISSLSSAQIVINPNFTVASHVWNVQVFNPGGVPSNQFQFNVVSPDLIVENVLFNPTSAVAGNSLTIGFDVRNVGTGNAPPTQARLRLSLDNTLTSSDLPLSPLDVNIPAVAAGSSTHFSAPITVPNTTPPDSYFVGVFADWNNQGNQSDVTNDAGLSLPNNKLTITGTGVPRPVITPQSQQSQTKTAGDSATFNVEVSGTGPFSYQWLRDGHLFADTATSSLKLDNISTNLAGSYTALVSNIGGTAGTTPVTLIVNPSSVPLPPTTTTLRQVQCRANAFDQNLPTVIITHGWEPFGDFNDPNLFDLDHTLHWMEAMAQAIDARLMVFNRRANICFYTWLEAFTHTPYDDLLLLPIFQIGGVFVARSFVDDHGNNLAKQLATLFPPGYGDASRGDKIQFIGHSFGSLVNARAVNHLNQLRPEILVSQFTILDAPNFDGGFNVALFHALLPQFPSVGFVDNYFGDSLLPVPPALGGPIVGTIPKSVIPLKGGGLLVHGNHSGVHDRYCETIEPISGICNPNDSPNTTDGFNYSALISNGSLPNEWEWHPNPILAAIGSVPIGTFVAETETELGQIVYTVAGTVNQVKETVSGQTRNLFQFVKSAIAPTQQQHLTRALNSSLISSPSAIATNLTIPADAAVVTFAFRFSKPGNGDWVTVSFNDTLLFSFLGTSFVGNEYQHVQIPVGNIAGQTGVLTVVLNEAGDQDAEVLVSNFQFLSSGGSSPTLPDLVVSSLDNPPASVVAGGTFTMTSTTTNQGSGPASHSATLHYLSVDNTITSADVAVPGTYGFEGLAAGDSLTLTTTITIPTTVVPGTYFFAACADGFLEVDESDETNNCRVATTMLVVNPACTYSISPTSQSYSANGGTNSVSISAPNGCTWTAASNDPQWLAITSANSGSGNGTVNYSVAANPGTTSRTGTLTIAGQMFTVTQAGTPSCSYSISPTSQSSSSSGGTGSVGVTASSGCNWTATSNASWITITSGSNGGGNGTVNYSVAANSGTTSRSGTLTIAGQTFTVTQGGQVSSGITVLTPNGGETWSIGSTQAIQWNSSGVSGNVKIELSRDGGTSWTTLVNNTANDGSQSWSVSGPAMTQARVRVSSMSNASIADTSNANFTINTGSITVSSPNGGETWPIGSTHAIQWSSNGISGNVKIALSRDGGATWTTLSNSTANNGTKNWKVTKPATTQARIRVSSVNSPSVADTSNANFTIQ